MKAENSLNVLGTAAIQMTSNRAWFGMDVANRPGEMSSVAIEQNDTYGNNRDDPDQIQSKNILLI